VSVLLMDADAEILLCLLCLHKPENNLTAVNQ